MKYFKKLEGEDIYLSPRSIEDIEIFVCIYFLRNA